MNEPPTELLNTMVSLPPPLPIEVALLTAAEDQGVASVPPKPSWLRGWLGRQSVGTSAAKNGGAGCHHRSDGVAVSTEINGAVGDSIEDHAVTASSAKT